MDRDYWSCEHGKAKNVFQYLENHEEGFQTFINIDFGDVAYEVDIFNSLRASVTFIDEGSPEIAKRLLESLAGLIYEGNIDYTYGESYEPGADHVERMITDFKSTLDDNLKRILEDGQRNGEDD